MNSPSSASSSSDEPLFIDDFTEFQEHCFKLINEKATVVYDYETRIDRTKDLYLFTWSPDPAQLPNCMFSMQHEYLLGIVADFLKGCHLGLACVEATQLGNPHYHGWYQLSDDPIKEGLRIACVKTMQKFSNTKTGVKITKSKGHYKRYRYTNHHNCLYYYKKDLIQAQLMTQPNPITWSTVSNVNFKNYTHFFAIEGDRQTVADLHDKVSLRQFYMDFYKDST